MRWRFGVDELQDLTLAEPFPFTKGCRTLKIASRMPARPFSLETMLFDVENDPRQGNPISDPEVEARLVTEMVRLMRVNNAPDEQFERLRLSL